MNKISIDNIIKATKGRLISPGKSQYIIGVKHDSRECEAGDMFVAVQGENQDGHDYIPQVLKSGCRVFLVSHLGEWMDDVEKAGGTIICVGDTVYAMGQLAKEYLETLDAVKIAVTGSVGKTSVRDMVYYALSERYICGRNVKNYNNDIGLPLSILKLDDTVEVVVLEIGMDKFGEIDRLGEIIKPHIAIITNIGVSHIENLGSREGIFKAKMEIAPHITPREDQKGTLIFARDDMLIRERITGDYAQLSVGTSNDDDYVISKVDDRGIEGIEFSLEHCGKFHRINLPVPGQHNAINSALAIAAGQLLGVEVETAIEGLCKTQLTGRRLNHLSGKSVQIIDDTYNASPTSMKSALKVLENSSGGCRKVAILGDMYELGQDSDSLHHTVGEFAAGLHIDLLIALGQNAESIVKGCQGGDLKVRHFKKKGELYEAFDKLIEPGDMIMVKGSRGMKMEEVVEKLLEY
ncbi:MAG: UDP-N-acetylmuramoyl-tripeptide--D-alanyl-D-alanine ligase [Clostridiales bacterium]|nr:UDP-N-acetylmuramoyl-tripeptide--D-alanyl-D-alanine ligase [Clostridiales bacterium]